TWSFPSCSIWPPPRWTISMRFSRRRSRSANRLSKSRKSTARASSSCTHWRGAGWTSTAGGGGLPGRAGGPRAPLTSATRPKNFHPLGLALFRERIRPPVTNVRTIIEEEPRPRSFIIPQPDSPVVEKERKLYALTEDDGANPYHWEFDLCNVTLGSFRYRKLS